jgi:hypothetical protein
MEEKTLLTAAKRVRGGEPLALAAKVRLDYGARFEHVLLAGWWHPLAHRPIEVWRLPQTSIA